MATLFGGRPAVAGPGARPDRLHLSRPRTRTGGHRRDVRAVMENRYLGSLGSAYYVQHARTRTHANATRSLAHCMVGVSVAYLLITNNFKNLAPLLCPLASNKLTDRCDNAHLRQLHRARLWSRQLASRQSPSITHFRVIDYV